MLSHNLRRRQPCVYLFIRFFLFSILTILFWPRCNTTATLPESLPPVLLPLVMWKQPFSVATSSAFTLTRDTHDKLGVEVKVMGCESYAPAPTIHTVDIYTKAARHTNTRISFMCVYAISHSILLAAQPCPETKQELVLQTG